MSSELGLRDRRGYQEELDWVDEFVREEVEPLDLVIDHAWDMATRCARR